MQLYHGTSTRYLAAMFRNGVQPCNATADHGVLQTCLTDDLAVAWYHAEFMSECEDHPPVVWAWPLIAFEPGGWIAEDNIVRLGVSAGRGLRYQKQIASGRLDVWQLFELSGFIGYTRPLPVTVDNLLRGTP